MTTQEGFNSSSVGPACDAASLSREPHHAAWVPIRNHPAPDNLCASDSLRTRPTSKSGANRDDHRTDAIQIEDLALLKLALRQIGVSDGKWVASARSLVRMRMTTGPCLWVIELKVINCLEIPGNFLLSGLDNLFFLTIDELLYLRCFLHDAIEPIDTRDIGAKIQTQRGSTRKNLAIATACWLSISSECCCTGLPFCTISMFAPGTGASVRVLICSRSSLAVTCGVLALPFNQRRLKHIRIRPAVPSRACQIWARELAWLVWLEKLALSAPVNF